MAVRKLSLSSQAKVARCLLVSVFLLLCVIIGQQLNPRSGARPADVSTPDRVHVAKSHTRIIHSLLGQQAAATPEPCADVSTDSDQLVFNDDHLDLSLPAVTEPQWDDVSSCLRDELTSAGKDFCWGEANVYHITDKELPALHRLEAQHPGGGIPSGAVEAETLLSNWVDFPSMGGIPGKQAAWAITTPPADDGFLHVLVDKVPCALHGCCSVPLVLRPNSTDLRSLFNHFVQNEYRFLQNLQGWSPQYILDAGGVGMAPLLFALMYPKAKILRIEPHPDNFNIGVRNAIRFGNIQQVNIGLWNRQTTLQMCDRKNTKWGEFWPFESDQQQSWFSREPQDPSCEELGGSVAVDGIEVAHLSNVMKTYNYPRFDFIKMDIEGAEAKVFQGSWIRKMLEAVSVYVAELHPWYLAPEHVHQVFSDVSSFRNLRYDENEIFIKKDLYKC